MPTAVTIADTPALTVTQAQRLLALIRASETYRADACAYPDLQAVLLAEVNRKFTISGATNAAPIVITASGHNFADDEGVFIESVGGNTNANGEWLISGAGGSAFNLVSSAGNAAYTSGGVATSLKSKQLAAIAVALDCLGDGTEGIQGGKEGLIYSTSRDREALVEEALGLLFALNDTYCAESCYAVDQRDYSLSQRTQPYAR